MYLRCGPITSYQYLLVAVPSIPSNLLQLLQRHALFHGLYLCPPLTTAFLACLVVGGPESAPSLARSQVTIDSGRVPNFKTTAVCRGFLFEGDLLLDYLEKGTFHALEKPYLEKFILALVRGRSLPSTSTSLSVLV